MITVKFDKKSRRQLAVREDECSFCHFKRQVATANAELFICAECFADYEMPGAISAARREGLSGEIFVRACLEDL